jgi:hypothetical protein
MNMKNKILMQEISAYDLRAKLLSDMRFCRKAARLADNEDDYQTYRGQAVYAEEVLGWLYLAVEGKWA